MLDVLGRQTQERNTPLRRVPGTRSAGERRRGNGDGGERWSQRSAEDARLVRADVNEADLRRCNRCAEPFATRRARRQAHGSTRTCQRHLCTECHAKETGKTPIPRATGPTATPPTEAPVPPEPQTSTNTYWTLSKMDALPRLQTIQWIPRGRDRRYATVRLQALDRAMQAA